MKRHTEMDHPTTKAMIVIPKHQAAFRMDGNGRWHSKDGPFCHQRIIDYFNAAINRDETGYFIRQQREGAVEKVYFPHAGTALFVVEVVWGNRDQLKLNTGLAVILDPRCLFICEDHLYYRWGDESAKFNQHAMVEIADRLSCEKGRYYFSIGGTRIALEEQTLDP